MTTSHFHHTLLSLPKVTDSQDHIQADWAQAPSAAQFSPTVVEVSGIKMYKVLRTDRHNSQCTYFTSLGRNLTKDIFKIEYFF